MCVYVCLLQRGTKNQMLQIFEVLKSIFKDITFLHLIFDVVAEVVVVVCVDIFIALVLGLVVVVVVIVGPKKYFKNLTKLLSFQV